MLAQPCSEVLFLAIHAFAQRYQSCPSETSVALELVLNTLILQRQMEEMLTSGASLQL